MAVTHIHAIKATVGKSIDYICDGSKTDEGLLVDSYCCTPETAALHFMQTIKQGNDSPNLAYHMIQSFAPGEVTQELAHKIGIEWADRVLGGRYSYVVATHIDHRHIHNHVIFCSVDNKDHNHYNDCISSYWNLRHISDDLCRENGLSLIPADKNIGRKYRRWLEDGKGNSWMQQLKKDIDASAASSNNYEDFISSMRSKGYTIEGEKLGSGQPKYITFRPHGINRKVRGSAHNFGSDDYTKEGIKRRIKDRSLAAVSSGNVAGIEATGQDYFDATMQAFKSRHDAPSPAASASQPAEKIGKLIDLTGKKYQNNVGLRNWAIRQNNNVKLQSMSALSHHGLRSVNDIPDSIKDYRDQGQALIRQMKNKETQLKGISELISLYGQLSENKQFYTEFKRAKNPDAVFRKYESQILIYQGAKKQLEKFGIDNPNKLRLQDLTLFQSDTQTDLERLKTEYNLCSAKISELKQIEKNLRDHDPSITLEHDREKERNK